MPYKLAYTYTMQQVDNAGNPDGFAYSFSGQQTIATNSPQSSDLTTAGNAAGADMVATLVAKFPIQQSQDSAADGSGGQG